MKEKTKNRAITYGFKENADVLASGDSISYNYSGEPEGVIFRVDQDGKSFPVVIEGVFGRNHVYASTGSSSFNFWIKF